VLSGSDSSVGRRIAPALTVVIPAYNQRFFVADAVESVLVQGRPDVEIIVVDDGSSDDIEAVLAPYASRLRLLRQKNRERGAARNAGLAEARGEYVSFLDADDLWLPGKMARDLRLFDESPDVAVVHSRIVYGDVSGRPIKEQKLRAPSGYVLKELACHNFISLCTAVARREAVVEVGGFSEERQLSGSEDWELWVRLAAEYPIAFHPHTTAVYRQLPTATLRNPEKMRLAYFRAVELIMEHPKLEVHRNSLEPIARANGHLLLATQYGRSGSRSRGLVELARAIQTRPQTVLSAETAHVAARLALPVRLATYLQHRRARRYRARLRHEEGTASRRKSVQPKGIH
jgi:GT2 family glycosyltransferase